jgi:hypothetical protein
MIVASRAPCVDHPQELGDPAMRVEAADQAGRATFERGPRLVEANCGDCAGASRQGLEEGVAATCQKSLRIAMAEFGPCSQGLGIPRVVSVARPPHGRA